jgi:hypothetical protein
MNSQRFPATSPRGIGKNTDAAALLKEGRTRPTRDFVQSPAAVVEVRAVPVRAVERHPTANRSK